MQASRRPRRHDPRRCGTRQIGELVSRVYFTSKRIDPWEHEDRSSFGGGSQSPSRPLRNGDHNQLFIWRWNLFLGKYVTEMTEETQENHIDDTGEQTSMPTTSSPTTTLPYHLRVWIDVEPGPYDKSCFEVSKKMIRMLRHDPSVLREEDGAVEFRILAQMFRSEFTSSQHCSIRTWLAGTILYFRAIQGHC